MDAHAMRGAEALLGELKRHNEEMLREHKNQLEAQYQEQLAGEADGPASPASDPDKYCSEEAQGGAEGNRCCIIEYGD